MVRTVTESPTKPRGPSRVGMDPYTPVDGGADFDLGLIGGNDWVAQLASAEDFGWGGGVASSEVDKVRGSGTCTDGHSLFKGRQLVGSAEVAGVAGAAELVEDQSGFEPLAIAHTFIRASMATMRDLGVSEEQSPSFFTGSARCAHCQTKPISWVCIKSNSSSRMKKCQECSVKKISCSFCESTSRLEDGKCADVASQLSRTRLR